MRSHTISLENKAVEAIEKEIEEIGCVRLYSEYSHKNDAESLGS